MRDWPRLGPRGALFGQLGNYSTRCTQPGALFSSLNGDGTFLSGLNHPSAVEGHRVATCAEATRSVWAMILYTVKTYLRHFELDSTHSLAVRNSKV